MWGAASPAGLFHNAWVAYHYHGVVLFSQDIGITEVTTDAAALARAAEYLAWLKPRMAAHEGFVALLEHYRKLGVEGRFTGHDGYGGEAINWGTIVPRESLPRLERLAQERAGFTTPEARASAAEAFRIYILRHYDRNWQENQRTMPPIDQSPYVPNFD
jgi:hypothetical protein